MLVQYRHGTAGTGKPQFRLFVQNRVVIGAGDLNDPTSADHIKRIKLSPTTLYRLWAERVLILYCAFVLPMAAL